MPKGADNVLHTTARGGPRPESTLTAAAGPLTQPLTLATAVFAAGNGGGNGNGMVAGAGASVPSVAAVSAAGPSATAGRPSTVTAQATANATRRMVIPRPLFDARRRDRLRLTCL